jgi:guanylate kinase
MTAPLFILSGPSGSGKSTVLGRLLAAEDVPLRVAVSATTRPPRDKEREDVDYHFWTRDRFEAAVKTGEFLEWADVFGNLYGTLRSEVEPHRKQGTGVILDIDVQGAAQVRQQCPDTVTLFLRTSSLDAYEQRLRRRGTESEEAIQRRLQGARRELERMGEYQYVVINDNLDKAVAELRAIVSSHFQRSEHAG